MPPRLRSSKGTRSESSMFTLPTKSLAPFHPSRPSKTMTPPSSPPHPFPHLHRCRKESGCQLHRQRPLRIRGHSYRLKVVGYASRPWMGNSIKPLVVGIGVLIKQGDDSEIRGLEGRLSTALKKEWVSYSQIATRTTEASPPSTLGDDSQCDAPLIMSCCDGRQRVGSDFVLECTHLISTV